jgi:carbon starvation protein CstA
VDYIPLPRWRTFLIQLLNIAGVGPIFGAIMGACFGPVAFLWITLGGIFMGAMHDYISGVILLRHDGLSLPEIIGHYLGGNVRQVMRAFSIVLLVLVGVVFILSPAGILANLVPAVPRLGWVILIIVYYFIATLLPVDKVIAKIYPLFGAALIFMAVGLLWVILTGDYTVPDLTFETLRNYQPNADKMPIVPTLFISIACGAISGFHATQSSLMARCVNNEKECRKVFYGSMITESIIALVWAAIAMAFFHGPDSLAATLAEHGGDAGWAVNEISVTTLGVVGGILAMLGVVAAPITSGDTAFRSARLIIADIFNIEQKSMARRLMISIPLFVVGIVVSLVDFDVVWRYFAWTNQALATIVLWSITIYLHLEKRNYWVALIPAVFMTYICASFVFVSKQFIGMGAVPMAYIWGGLTTLALTGGMVYMMVRNNKSAQLKK